MDFSNLESVVETWGKRIFNVLKESKDNPPLLGLELIGLGAAIKTFNVDFVIFDFSGNHVASPTIQKSMSDAVKKSTSSGQSTPTWVTDVLQFGVDISTILPLGNTLQAIPAVQNSEQSAGVTPQPSAFGGITNILGLLGIKLPTQITLSEVLILGGILLMSEPLLKALAGSLSGLLKSGGFLLG